MLRTAQTGQWPSTWRMWEWRETGRRLNKSGCIRGVDWSRWLLSSFQSIKSFNALVHTQQWETERDFEEKDVMYIEEEEEGASRVNTQREMLLTSTTYILTRDKAIGWIERFVTIWAEEEQDAKNRWDSVCVCRVLNQWLQWSVGWAVLSANASRYLISNVRPRFSRYQNIS